jgi:hypothetical protein
MKSSRPPAFAFCRSHTATSQVPVHTHFYLERNLRVCVVLGCHQEQALTTMAHEGRQPLLRAIFADHVATQLQMHAFDSK